MAELYFSANLDDETTLYIAPITNRCVSSSGQTIDDPSGYFLYEVRKSQLPHDVKILARLLTEESAIELSQMLNME